MASDEYAFLGVAFDIDDCHDVYGSFLFVEFLHDDFCRVRYFLVVVEEDFLANDFGDEEACGFVGECVLAEVWS